MPDTCTGAPGHLYHDMYIILRKESCLEKSIRERSPSISCWHNISPCLKQHF